MPDNLPEDALWLEDIEEQLISLVRTATQRWQRIAVLLIEVEAQELWRGAADSYTAWVQGMAAKAGTHASGLWRILKAGQFYNHMREQQLSAQPATEAAMPELIKLESAPSPESLDLLEKISRAAPPEQTLELVQSTLAGETKRNDLRIVWQDYRPAISGNARGRKRQGYGEAFAGVVEQLQVQQAEIVQALRASRGGFLDGRTACHQWRIQTDVMLTASSATRIRFEAVCAELATPEQAKPGLHGVAIRVQQAALPSGQELLAMADFVDTLWLAVPAVLSETALQLAPAGVGVLAFAPERQIATAAQSLPQRLVQAVPPASQLRVAHCAGEISRQADWRGELALELLKRLL